MININHVTEPVNIFSLATNPITCLGFNHDSNMLAFGTGPNFTPGSDRVKSSGSSSSSQYYSSSGNNESSSSSTKKLDFENWVKLLKTFLKWIKIAAIH